MLNLREAVQQSAEELYEDAPCGYLLALADWTIVRANRTFLHWTGYRAEELVDRRFADLLTAGGRIFFDTHIAPMMSMQGQIREIAVDIRCADGRQLPSLLNAAINRGKAGRPDIVKVMVFDATERRQYEHELLEERKRAQEAEARSRALASTLQESIIPTEPSQIPGLDVAAGYLPGGATVGGDFYDVFQTRRGDWAVVIGDVAGKGPDAARVTAAARYTIRASAMHSPQPSVLLRALNEALLSQNLDRYCTVAYARVRPEGSTIRLTVGSAGHPLPIMFDPSTGAIETVGKPGTLAGVLSDIHTEDVEVSIPVGGYVVLYTDGITEARSPGGEFFGEDGLKSVLSTVSEGSADDVCHAICDAATAFQGGSPCDDIAVLVLHRPHA